jgi:LysM repeat protein
MAALPLNEMEEFRAPRRRPWLLLVLLAGVAVVVWQRYGGDRPREAPEPPPAVQPGVSAEVVPAAAPAPADAADAARPAPPEQVEPLAARARALQAAGDLVAARDAWWAVLEAGPAGMRRREAEQALGTINVELVTTPRAMPEKVDVVVQRGDSLDRIAKQYGTTVDLIQLSNTISNPHLIKAGDRLRVLEARFELTCSKSRNDLLVTINGRFFKRYQVGTGKFGKTPVGSFVVEDKIKEPVWWRPDGKEIPFGHPENILGTRWLALKAQEGTPDVRGYGIHGTWDDASIGKAESAGCLRMHNGEVEELYLYIPVGTPVRIVD